MLPNGGNRPPLSINDINGSSGFSGRGNNLNAYRGTLFYRPDNSTGYFSSGTINISDFYSTSGSSPVVPGSATYTSGSSIILPALFNKLYVTVYGGGGGGGGGCILKTGSSYVGGGTGSTGGTTTFGVGQSYAISAGGGGGGGGAGRGFNWVFGSDSGAGTTGSDGAYSPNQSGVAGGGSGGAGAGSESTTLNGYAIYYFGGTGGPGGKGGKNYGLIFDIDVMGWSAIKNYYGASIPVSIGGGGGGGAGGVYPNFGVASSGSPGGGGSIVLSWT